MNCMHRTSAASHLRGGTSTRNDWLVGIALMTLFVVANTPCFGQVFSATLTGVVSDTSGAVIPKVKLALTNTATMERRLTTSNELGRYTFSQLQPGPYEISAEHSGFNMLVRKGIKLMASESVALDLSLTVGSLTQGIEVTASAPLVNSQNADESIRVDTVAVENLPQNVRSPFALVFMNGGSQEAFDIKNATAADQNYNRFGLNGGRTESTLILIDGVTTASGNQWNGLLYSPTLDSVSEVQLVRNSYDASVGRSGGGVFSMVTKSGTMQYHGEAFDFLRNSDLDANNYFNNKYGIPNPFFGRNQFGGTFGGPVWKSKRLFIFGSYEGLRAGSPTSLLATVPTSQEKQGNFSADATIYDPWSIITNPDGSYSRTPMPGNVVPAGRMDPVGAKAVSFFPDPNQPGLVSNWYGSEKYLNATDHYDIRVDWSPTDKDSMFFRWSQAPRMESVNPPFAAWGAADSGTADQNHRGQIVFGDTLTISPSFVLNVSLGYGFWTEQDTPNKRGSPTLLGFTSSQASQWQGTSSNLFPSFGFTNYQGLFNGGLLYQPQSTKTIAADATKIRGRHTFKFGTAMEFGILNGPGTSGWIYSPGFGFDYQLTNADNVIGNNSTGSPIASALFGVGGGGTAYNPPEAQRHKSYGFYAQDTWQLSRRLTVNYGLRYELQMPISDKYSRFSNFNFGGSSALVVPGMNLQGGMVWESKYAWAPDYRDFAPRVGLAYKLTDKLVFRAGYGIYFVPTLGGGNISGYSSFTPMLGQNPDGTPLDLVSNPFPNGMVPSTGKTLGGLTSIGSDVDVYARNHPNGYVQNYSADFQFDLGHGFLAELGYAGNGSRKLAWGIAGDYNQLPNKYLSMGNALFNVVPNPFYGYITVPGALSQPTIQQAGLLVPFPQYNSVGMDGSTPGAASSYNALVAKFTKRWSNGLYFVGSFAWSKAIDDSSETQAWEVSDSAFRDMGNWGLERSISAHDIPLAFAGTIVYELPVGRGKALGKNMNRILDGVAGGWQISSLIAFQSGIPNPMGTTGAMFGRGFQPVDLTSGDAVSVSHRTPEHWINTAAFSQPCEFCVGTAPRRITQFRQDGVHNMDLKVAKSFPITEKVRAQFSGEFLNLTNTPQFGTVDGNYQSSTFGQSTWTWNQPRNIQFGLKLVF